MAEPLITDIQRYSIHDGDGIRTTVFFKGCPLRCAWCHNPETQRFTAEILYNAEKCSGCLRCTAACPEGGFDLLSGQFVSEHCISCGKCAEACLNGARELSGKYVPPAELVRQLVRDLPFYEESGGGVTLSGGEVLAQDPGYVMEVLRRLYEQGIRVNIDTCGQVPEEVLLQALPFTDTFLYDLKLAGAEEHRRYTGADNRRILSNLRAIGKAGARIRIRIPLIDPVNTSEQETAAMIEALAGIQGILSIDLLKYHDTGSGKYARLGRAYGSGMETPGEETLHRIARQFEEAGYRVSMGG